MKNYRVNYATGGVVREIRKGVKRLGEAAKKHVARKDTESVRDVRAKGGRTGLKKGGPKPGTYDYFLLHKREKKAEGGRSTKISKRGPVYNKNTGRKIIR